MAGDESVSLIEYPSPFPIKVMGVNHPDLEPVVVYRALSGHPLVKVVL